VQHVLRKLAAESGPGSPLRAGRRPTRAARILRPRSVEIDPIAVHRHTLLGEQPALDHAFGNAAVGSDDPMPRQAQMGRGQNASDKPRRFWIDPAIRLDAAARNASDSLDDSRDARLATLTLPAYGVHTGFLFSTKAAIPSRPSGATALHEIASAMISYALAWVNSICL